MKRLKSNLLILLAFMVACGIEETEPQLSHEEVVEELPVEELTINPPIIMHGRVYFKDYEDFGNFFREIVNKDIVSVRNLNLSANTSNFTRATENGFISYEYAENVLSDEELISMNIEAGYFEEAPIEDPYFASVLNIDREIQVADTIHKIENEYSFSYVVSQA